VALIGEAGIAVLTNLPPGDVNVKKTILLPLLLKAQHAEVSVTKDYSHHSQLFVGLSRCSKVWQSKRF
jgi:hypothetical protein